MQEQEFIDAQFGAIWRQHGDEYILVRYATPEERRLYLGSSSAGFSGLGDVTPTPNNSPSLFGLDASTVLLIALGIGAVIYLQSGGKGKRRDEIGNKIEEGDKIFLVDYTSPDEEYVITNEVAAKNKTQAITRMKKWAKDKREPMRGAKWDAEEV